MAIKDPPLARNISLARARMARLTNLPLESFRHAATEAMTASLEELLATQEELRRQNEEIVAHQDQLAQEKLKYQKLFDFAPDGYLVTTLTGQILEANRTAAWLLNVPQAVLIHAPLLRFVPKCDRERFGIVLQQIRQNASVRYFEMPFKPHKREPFEAAITASAEGDPPVECVRWMIHDVSIYKGVERALAQQADELRRSNSELEGFARVASHDLQEPLRMVISFTQLLASRYQDKLDSDANEFIGYAVDGAIRMQQLIRDLLAYSAVGADKARKPVDCNEVIRRVLQTLRSSLEQCGAVITCGSLPTVLGNETELVQLFQNLIGNAIKFRSAASPRIDLSAECTPEGWRFLIRDNGIGIPSEYANRIFVVFERLHSQTEYEGSGIGLAICKKIAEGHGGRIWVNSAPAAGSTFYVVLPAPASTVTLPLP